MNESIWADGIPAKINKEDVLTPEDLQKMAINFIIKDILIPNGYKLEKGFPRIGFPNIICVKDNKVYAIIVFGSMFPNVSVINDKLRIEFVKQSKTPNITPLYANVGFISIDKERASKSIGLKGDLFKPLLPGFVLLNDEEKQNTLDKKYLIKL